MAGPPNEIPQIIAFLFCKDVIQEESGGTWPFRIFEGAYVTLPDPPDVLTLWRDVPVKVFIGLSNQTVNEHRIELKVFAPDGEELGTTEFRAVPGPEHLTNYRTVDLLLQANRPGSWLFSLRMGEHVLAFRFFTITHTQASA